MYNITKTADRTAAYIMELIADTEEDVASLPTHYAPGSTCIVVSPASVYILNSKKKWVKLG